jgi:hypothetical protein
MTNAASSRPEQACCTPRLAGPVAAASAVRLALLAAALLRTGVSVIFSGDTASYLEPGRNLLLHGRFVTAGLPEIDRTPGYPLFLAVASLPGTAIAAVVQVILSAFSVILVWRLARAVFDEERVALLSAWLFAFEPISVIYSVRLLSETLFLALLLPSLERLAVFLRDRRLRELAFAGLWLAAATFVRPVSYYLPAALALGLFLVVARVPGLPPQRQRPVAGDPGLPPQRQRPVAGDPGLPPQRQRPVAGDPGLRWKAPLVLLLSVLPWLAAWQLRNWIESGFGGFTSVVVENLYFYQAAEVTARMEQRSFADVQNDLGYANAQAYVERHPEQSGWNRARRLAFMKAAAGRVLRAHPGAYLAVQLEGSALVAFTPCIADLLRLVGAFPLDRAPPKRMVHEGPRAALRLAQAHPWLAAAMAALELQLLGLYLLAARGTARLGARNSLLWMLLGVSFYFIAVSGGTQAVGRYRLPVMPIVCIFAAAGLQRKNP